MPPVILPTPLRHAATLTADTRNKHEQFASRQGLEGVGETGPGGTPGPPGAPGPEGKEGKEGKSGGSSVDAFFLGG